MILFSGTFIKRKPMTDRNYDVIIVGGGIIGRCAAYYLTEAGAKVLLIDRNQSSSTTSASSDLTRIFRINYGANEFYSRMAMKSFFLWSELAQKSGTNLFTRCGMLSFGDSKDAAADILDANHVIKTVGGDAQIVSASAYPQFRYRYGVIDNFGGVLHALDALGAILG